MLLIFLQRVNVCSHHKDVGRWVTQRIRVFHAESYLKSNVSLVELALIGIFCGLFVDCGETDLNADQGVTLKSPRFPKKYPKQLRL